MPIMKKLAAFYMLVLSLIIAWGIFFIIQKINAQRPSAEASKSTAHAVKATGECLQCHQKQTPAITKQYLESEHYDASVTCLDCHKAVVEDEEHVFFHNGFKLSREVTAGACATCHMDEYKEFERSRACPSGLDGGGRRRFFYARTNSARGKVSSG